METAATPVPLAKNPSNELDTLRWLLELYSPGKTLQCHPLPHSKRQTAGNLFMQQTTVYCLGPAKLI